MIYNLMPVCILVSKKVSTYTYKPLAYFWQRIRRRSDRYPFPVEGGRKHVYEKFILLCVFFFSWRKHLFLFRLYDIYRYKTPVIRIRRRHRHGVSTNIYWYRRRTLFSQPLQSSGRRYMYGCNAWGAEGRAAPHQAWDGRVDGQREDDGRVLLGGDAVQGLQVPVFGGERK